MSQFPRIDPGFGGGGFGGAPYRGRGGIRRASPGVPSNPGDQAVDSNLLRFEKILEGYKKRFDRGMGYIDDFGKGSRAQIERSYQSQLGAVSQSAMDRGLYSSETMAAGQFGATRHMNESMLNLDSTLAQQRAGLDAQLSGDLLGFAERRNDPEPPLYVGADGSQSYAQAPAEGYAGYRRRQPPTRSVGGGPRYRGYGGFGGYTPQQTSYRA